MHSLDDLKRELRYDPATGLLWWLHGRKGRRLGRPAGSYTSRRGEITYVNICLDGVDYAAHRLAWAFMTGRWPDGLIEHADLDRRNNRWVNLREANASQNQANTVAKNPELPKGVTRSKTLVSRPYVAKITVNRKAKNLGNFATAEEASEAYMDAATAAFGEFARQ